MSRREDASLHGVLLLDKPQGPTSHDMVSMARRALGTRKVGHAGTLDPAATGLLVLLVGKATRLSRYFLENAKRYEGTVRLGLETDSCDREGAVLAKQRSDLKMADVEEAAASLTGHISQVPPMASAVKVDGRKLYELHRRGEKPAEMPLREVEVSAFRLSDLRRDGDEQLVEIDVECSSGTYVRALARDLGAALGVGGMLDGLRRTSSGAFRIDEAVTVDELKEAADPTAHLLGMAAAIGRGMPLLEIRPAALGRLMNGATVEPQMVELAAVPKGLFAAVQEGRLIGIYRGFASRGRPETVIGEEPA